MGRTTVLLTAFGPFPSQPVNATMALVEALSTSAKRAFPDVVIVPEVLATEWHSAPRRVSELIEAHAPDIAVHFGISSRARGFEIEARGRNHCGIVADASGMTPGSTVLSPDGPDWLSTNLPATAIVHRLRQRGIPAFVSWDAGSYLCNALLYHALVLARGNPALRRNGFVHIPHDLPAPGQRVSGRSRSGPLTFDQAVEGGLEIVAACLGRRAVTVRPHQRGLDRQRCL